jgi:hypothetical protein
MARRTKEQKQEAAIGGAFPYSEYERHPSWVVLERALAVLEANDDLELRTASRYVVGFLLEQLAADRAEAPAASLSVKNGHSTPLSPARASTGVTRRKPSAIAQRKTSVA